MIIDLFEQHAAEYEASAATPSVVETSPVSCLAVEGQGSPGEEEFDGGLGAVMATAGALAGACRSEGRDFAVGKLEAVWWTDEVEGLDFAARPRSQWRWKLLVRVPDFVSAGQAAAAADRVAAKGVVLEPLVEGRCVQILHVGPFRGVRDAMEAIRRFAGERGLEIAGRHHEICLTDPRHTAMEEMRTLVRYPIR